MDIPIVHTGSNVSLVWKVKRTSCVVTKVRKCSDVKHDSKYKYTLKSTENEVIKTRLSHLNWKIIDKGITNEITFQKTSHKQIPSHKYILAPMV